MHLLSVQAGALQNDGEAIDLAQARGRIVFASAADSELQLLAGAADASAYDGLRLANLLRLSHHLSVDLWVENTVRHASAVVLRLIGGAGYFRYGVDLLEAVCADRNIPLVLLPGDGRDDPQLRARSSIGGADWAALDRLLAAGGPANAAAALTAMQRLADRLPLDGFVPAAFPANGYWCPRRGLVEHWPEPRTADCPREPVASAPVPILFYRATLEGAGTATLQALIADLHAAGLAPLPMAVASLKSPASIAFLKTAFVRHKPDIILNLTGFSIGRDGIDAERDPFAETDCPIVQLVQSGRTAAQWRRDKAGLSAKDLAMLVVMPEMDGRIGGLIVGHKRDAVWHERTQCPLTGYEPDTDGVARAAELAANWVRLRRTPRAERRVGLVLSNYPLRDGRIANGVGYDTPQSTLEILRRLAIEGYAIDAAKLSQSGDALVERLQAGPTNADPRRGPGGATLSLADYRRLTAALPSDLCDQVAKKWGEPEADPFFRDGAFQLPVIFEGSVAILLQPGRRHGIGDVKDYHDPEIPPPHAYLAAYLWLRHVFQAHALIHNGKHGTLEWLPGKATVLGRESWPNLLWGGLPHLYPFIVNDPGEGAQAKRRTGAVIVDHLVPPLTRAESYGPLKDLEALLDEYYAASGMDRRRLSDLKRRILEFARDIRLDRDIALPADDDAALVEIDNFLCELKEAQICDGLHVFGRSPEGSLERDLVVALARSPRGDAPGQQSLIRALADDLGLGFDPLGAKGGERWHGPVPDELGDAALQTVGDVVEALENLAVALVDGRACPPDWVRTRAVLDTVATAIRPNLRASGPAEISALIDGLDGKFIAPGPSGAPSRGRLDVLPTGRNFYSVDTRSVPTQTAWELGRRSAEALVRLHFQQHGAPLRAVALSVWGTANMRTGGDDIAQALALIGAKPTWDPLSLRVSGYEIVPLAKLDRPRVDVTMRMSGLFRDAFPAQASLFDKAIRAIGALDEPEDMNPIATRMRSEALGLMAEGASEKTAAVRAGHRVFSSRPGTYGAGLGDIVSNSDWQRPEELADLALDFAQYAYGGGEAGTPERGLLETRLKGIDAVVHNIDNREHDMLDSDGYYQFIGGLVLAAETLSGARPAAYIGDHALADAPRAITLDAEIARLVRARVANPKWIAGMRRHGYKGAFEIAATVDFMVGFAATTGAVKPHHFDLAFAAYVEDETVAAFMQKHNRSAWAEMLARFAEARRRGLWAPRSNAAHALLEDIAP
jgi:cobaltochelatase CobN